MRDPFILINKSNFIEVLKKSIPNVSMETINSICVDCMELCPTIKVSYDVIVSTTKAIESENYNLFNSLLTTILQRDYNPKATPIKIQDSAFQLLKEISILADDFCIQAGLTTREGYIEYIEQGLRLMGKNYALNKFKYYNAKILQVYNESVEIKYDSNKVLTHKIKDFYESAYGIKTTDGDIIHFVRTADLITKNCIDPKNYLEVVLSRFGYMGGLTEPIQLYSQSSYEYYLKHAKNEAKSPEIDYEEQRLMEAKKRAEIKRQQLIQEL